MADETSTEPDEGDGGGESANPPSVAVFTPTMRDMRAVARMVNAFSLTTSAFLMSSALYVAAITRGGDRIGGIELMLAVYVMWALGLFVARPLGVFRTIKPYGELTFTFDEDDLAMDGTGLEWTTHWVAVNRLRQGRDYSAMWVGKTMVWIPHRALQPADRARLWKCTARRARGGALFGAGGPIIWIQLMVFGGLPLLFTLGFVVPTVIAG